MKAEAGGTRAGGVRPHRRRRARRGRHARQRAIDEASARIGEIVFDLVAKIVGREVDQSAHQDLVREAVAALNAEAPEGSSR